MEGHTDTFTYSTVISKAEYSEILYDFLFTGTFQLIDVY
jgi:hypothetical protein